MSDSYYDPAETDMRERKYEREITRLKADITKLESAPLCGTHAEGWYCERDHIKTKSGCVVCDFNQEIDRLQGVLREISEHPHKYATNIPESDKVFDFMYRVGIATGHCVAASLAKQGLEGGK